VDPRGRAVVRSLGGVAGGGVVRLLLRVTTASTCSSMMTTTTGGVVTMSMAMVVIVGGRRGHVVTAVGQMRRVLHTHLMSVMVGHMTLGRLHQRGLDVGHKLGHPAATFNYCSLFLVVCLPGLGLGNTYLIFHFLYEGVFRIVGEGVGTFICIPDVGVGSTRNTHTLWLACGRDADDGGFGLGAWTTFSQEQCQMTD